MIVRREIHLGRVWNAAALRVVSDRDEELAAVRAPGSQTAFAAGYPGKPVDRGYLTGDWEIEHAPWQQTFALYRMTPGRWYSVVHFHDGLTGDFLCWYVNFERPFLRRATAPLLDTLDLHLDLIVMPDGTTTWKDEDDWAWAIETGAATADEVAAVEACRQPVVDAAAARSYPFDDRWRDWRPRHDQPPAQLPDGWEDL